MATKNSKSRAPHKGHKIKTGRLVLYLVIAIIVIIAIAYAVTYKGIQNIGAGGNVTISSSGTVFMFSGSEYTAYMGSGNTIYFSRQPAFINSLIAVSLSKGTTVNVNYGTSYANIGMKLLSANGTSAVVHFSSISQSYAVSPDYQSIRVISQTTGNQSVVANTTAPITVTQHPGSTTITSVSTTVTTTTSQPNGYDAALSVLKSSSYYPIMENYSLLYHNTSSCTPSLYNKTYAANQYGSTPTGPATYANISTLVPFNMSYSLNSVGGDLYIAKYTTISHTTTSSGTALTMLINASDKSISNVTLSGVFYQLNLSQLNEGYINAERIGGACGIYVSSVIG